MLAPSKPRGYGSSDNTFYPMVILGAGMGGIGMACQLKDKLGFDQFRLFERQSGIGGTWWINRYPGVACDIPAIFYSFSFHQNPNWSSFFPSGEEILRYQQSIIEKYQLIDKIQLNSDVVHCQWDDFKNEWEITVRHLVPEIVRCKVLVSAVGGLVEPRGWPSDVTGHDKFQGEIFHSARWNENINLSGKNVLVVGTGCSAAQIVPKLLAEKGVKRVTQVMREAPWVVPRLTPPFGDEGWNKLAPRLFSTIPGLMNFIRKIVAIQIDATFAYFGASESSQRAREKLRDDLLAHLHKTAPTKYHQILTPNYDVGCKRRIFDTDWFPSLSDPRLELTTLGLKSMEEREIPCDVIILANGFEVSSWFHPLMVVGLDGKSLNSVFDKRGGPQMYKGTALDGFPNFFALFGPNSFSGHSSVILGLENQINHAIKLIRPLLQNDIAKIDLKTEAALSYNQEIQAALKNMLTIRIACCGKAGHVSILHGLTGMYHGLCKAVGREMSVYSDDLPS
ncbi:flavin-binding monooxygenase-like domain-containing protein [Trichoderma breve]|uniref:Flavin-binding monooxygenase-like domain-containing protein n=1 Tax=Trichoderma breve TaxID=2034170 RepID=A0A9W9BDL7_9HYPO|nr:flavin-binding monooxygenase-like domain-containing protein [Trichoderma breve]KAJ4857998.1 flavin-binding monooxygenase-like domain-containing protein [Trichoderma breve]